MSDFVIVREIITLISRINEDHRSIGRRCRVLRKMIKNGLNDEVNFIEMLVATGGIECILELYKSKRGIAGKVMNWIVKLSPPLQIIPVIVLFSREIIKLDDEYDESDGSVLSICKSFLGDYVSVWAEDNKDVYKYFVIDLFQNVDDALMREIEIEFKFPMYAHFNDMLTFSKTLVMVGKELKESSILANFFRSMIGSMSRVLTMIRDRPAYCIEKYIVILEGLFHMAVFLGELDQFKKLLCDMAKEFKGWVKLCLDEYKHFDWVHYHSWVVEFLELDKDEKVEYAQLILPSLNEHHSYCLKINRSNVLRDSLDRLSTATRKQLRSKLNLKFVGEEGRGDSLRREWFLVACEELLEQKFLVSYSEDLRRVIPTRLCVEDADVFIFAGRLMAMALLNKVSLGVSLDRVLYLCLAEAEVCVEDLNGTDPELYRHLKNYTKLESSLCIDETEKSVAEDEIQEALDMFLKSIDIKISWMKRGFDDVLGSLERKRFCQVIGHETLNGYLLGDLNEISIEDWKAYTDYEGYQPSEEQICWFWQVLTDMSLVERRDILYFWTSFKFLPPKGFGGLPMRLCIAKIEAPTENYPTSSTCFLLLKLPPYPSLQVMRDRLQRIRKEHTWFGLR